MSKKQIILHAITDLVADFFYYGRKDDEELSVSDVYSAIDSGEVTLEEMSKHFSNELINGYLHKGSRS